MTRFTLCAFAVLAATAPLPAAPGQAVPIPPIGRLRFEPLPGGRFAASGLRWQFVFDAARITFRQGAELREMEFDGARPHAKLEPAEQLRSVSNRFIGNDPARWQSTIPNYGRLRVAEIYRGIDLVYYGADGSLEYDMNLSPGADPALIRIRLSGGTPRIDSHGDLTAGLLQRRPVAYQLASNGTRTLVGCKYKTYPDGTFGFALDRYDRSRPLVIDPVLTFSAYVSGSAAEYARAIGHDRAGFLYIAGVTSSSDLTAAGDAQQAASGGTSDVFVAKLDPHACPASAIIYTTYFGGSGIETLNGMAVSPDGLVYLAGSTTSTNLPSVNPAQTALSGTRDGFVAILDPSQGTSGLLYSSYIGGTGDDTANDVAIDATGRMFVVGTTRSTDFPISGGPQAASAGSSDAFIAGFDRSRSGSATLIYSTYIGGAGADDGRSIAVDQSGNLWITGSTYSYDFPLAGNSFQSANNTSSDAFLTQVSPTAGVLYSTYIGGTGIDVATKVTSDAAGRILVTGYTTSSDFPVTPGVIRTVLAGSTDAFIMIWTPVASSAPKLTYSTYYGGSGGEVPYDIKADQDGNIYLAGYTTSGDLPVVGNALQGSTAGGVDGFALKLNPTRSGPGAIDYSSYVASGGTQIAYGLDVDANGIMYITGATTGSLFDSWNGAQRTTATGMQDAFVAGFNPCTVDLSLASYQFPQSGGTSTVTMNLSSDCRWAATNLPDWITVSPASGNAGGDIQITTAPNTTGADRTASITIGNLPFLVGQNP